jgi:hypothetical protein
MIRKYPEFIDRLVDLCNGRALATAFSKEGCHEDPAAMRQWHRVMALWFCVDNNAMTLYFMGRHKPSARDTRHLPK